jgi:uncharacterized protein YijF (DUF1287 family)
MIQSVVRNALYQRIAELETELTRQLERMPMQQVIDSGVPADILAKHLKNPVAEARALELMRRSIDARGRVEATRLSDDERRELCALLRLKR